MHQKYNDWISFFFGVLEKVTPKGEKSWRDSPRPTSRIIQKKSNDFHGKLILIPMEKRLNFQAY